MGNKNEENVKDEIKRSFFQSAAAMIDRTQVRLCPLFSLLKKSRRESILGQ